MNELDIEKELIYDEPTEFTASNPGSTNSGDNASLDAAPSSDGGQLSIARAGSAAGNATKPHGRSNARGLGKSFADIASGSSVGSYPTLERLIGPNVAPWPNSPIRTAQQRTERRRLEQSAYESVTESPSSRLIEDIRPGVYERMAVAESRIVDNHEDVKDLRRDMHDGVKQAIQLAVEDNRILDRRIDREVLPAIDRVARKNTAKLVTTTAIALIGFAANLLQLYYYFIVKHL